MNADVAVGVDGEVAFAPTGDVVEIARQVRSPTLDGVESQRALTAVSIQLASKNFSVLEKDGSGKKNLCNKGTRKRPPYLESTSDLGRAGAFACLPQLHSSLIGP